MNDTRKETEYSILELLAKRYCAPEWAFLSHVRNSTGYNARRTADAVAMNLYPSRGMEVWGFEVKVSRGDWLTEMKHPEKADVIAKYCDRWFLVIPDKDMVKPSELPGAWGLMIAKNNRVYASKEGAKLKPKPLDRNFIAAFMRRAWETHSVDARIAQAQMEGSNQGRILADKYYKVELDRKQASIDALQRKLTELEGAIGVSSNTKLDGELVHKDELLAAVKLVNAGRIDWVFHDLKRYANRLTKAVTQYEEAHAKTHKMV